MYQNIHKLFQSKIVILNTKSISNTNVLVIDIEIQILLFQKEVFQI